MSKPQKIKHKSSFFLPFHVKKKKEDKRRSKASISGLTPPTITVGGVPVGGPSQSHRTESVGPLQIGPQLACLRCAERTRRALDPWTSGASSTISRPTCAWRRPSEHTVRAYTGDVRAPPLVRGARGVAVADLDLSVLRAWLAEQTRRGIARTTIARQVSSAKTFGAWAAREGLLSDDPSARLQAPKGPPRPSACCRPSRRTR